MSPRLRRALKVVGLCALGYVSVWLAASLGILAMSAWARGHAPAGRTVAGIHHFHRVDDIVWRGSAPRPAGYRELAARGIHTVVDLRAERLTAEQRTQPVRAGLTLERLPVRDGQTPTKEQVARFMAIVRDAKGPVFVHCGAGVGRTGTMAAAYLVRTGQASAGRAAVRTVAVGPPSIEQIYYAASLSPEEAGTPPWPVRAISRAVDAPRRIKSYF